jgi:asparaginyl-tRNA synthetase
MIGYKQRIKEFITAEHIGSDIEIYGWVRTFRNNQFLSVNDGSTIQNLQVIVKEGVVSEELMKKLSTGAAVRAKGKLLESQGKGQITELVAEELEILGEANPEKFPMQMKRHSMEFLREKAHLRFRTNTFAAVFRIRHAMSFAIHKYFNDHGFFHLHSPIITGSDAEGAGEMFRVTNFDLENIPRDENGAIDESKDFFGKETNLTVSGQLEAELGAMALGNVYTFGPTFRAENSNTSRHLAEFWMIEPEMAFADLDDNMNLAEDF